MKNVKVLGPGCKRCDAAAEMVQTEADSSASGGDREGHRLRGDRSACRRGAQLNRRGRSFACVGRFCCRAPKAVQVAYLRSRSGNNLAALANAIALLIKLARSSAKQLHELLPRSRWQQKPSCGWRQLGSLSILVRRCCSSRNARVTSMSEGPSCTWLPMGQFLLVWLCLRL